jgi:acyl-CoA synthetase (AMP-forming)/AMP-acid ligase II
MRRLLHETLLDAAERDPHRTAVICGADRMTWGEIRTAAAGFAGALRSSGVQRGDRVVIQLEAGWRAAAALFGVLMADAVMVMVDPRTRAERLAFIVADCGATALVVEGRQPGALDVVLAGAPALRAVVAAGAGASLSRQGPPALLDLDAAFAAGAGPSSRRPAISTDLCALIYTSGSTGEPKGVMHSHQTMTFALDSMLEYLGITPEDRLFSALPLAFGYGLSQLLLAAARGATLVLEPAFAYPAQAVRTIQAEGATVFAGVPTMYAVLADAHARAPLQMASVRLATSAAAALPSRLHRPIAEMFPNAGLVRMYGQTECLRVSYLPPAALATKPESVGRAIPGTEVMLRDEAGQPVAPGERGVLHVRGAHVMLGYWNRPEATARALLAGSSPGDRVLCTHDIFTEDADGDLTFVARSDEMLKTRGEKVSPVEIETALLLLDGLREAAVVGVPDPLLGDAIVAYVAVAAAAGPMPGEREIRRHCARCLPPHMVPTRIVVMEALPKSANGKIDKRALAAGQKGEAAA